MRRREFITVVGGTAAWPLAARAQQPTMPVIGYLYSGAPETSAPWLAAFRKGLSETGFFEGKNVTIEYRWANNDSDQLPELAVDLVRRRVAVIVSPSTPAATRAAKVATETVSIPIVFRTGGDPVALGFVASLNRPGGNVTGVATMSTETEPKRFGLLRELLPGAARYAALVNFNSPNAGSLRTSLEEAASSIGRQVEFVSASSIREIDAAFANLMRKRPDALLIVPHGLFVNRRVQIVTHVTRQALPTIYPFREFAEIGGLMSYGSSPPEQFRQAGVYTGRILKGEKPASMPILRASKFEFVINLQTARILGIEIPATLLASADDVIE
jgi:ABC-type uncharacterized transport system substrate-binding protein